MTTCTAARAAASAAYPVLEQFVGGEWIGASGGLTSAVVDPSTEAVLGQLPLADPALLDRAFQAAHDAFPAWRRVPAIERSRLLRGAAAWLRARREEWAGLISLELGKPFAQSLLETETACEMLEWAAEESRRLYGRVIPARHPAMRMTATLDPVGPVAAMGGWNAPAITPARKIAAALGAGCTIVLKPSEGTPATALMLARAFAAVDLPAGVLNMVFGDPAAIGTAMATDPRIRLISFTGAIPVGKALAAQSAASLKRLVLELGGHAPVLVFGDGDIDALAVAAATAKFRNAGQVCTSPTRFVVQREVLERFTAQFVAAAQAVPVGDPFDPASAMGPVQNARRRAGIVRMIEDARERGARVEQGAAPAGSGFWQPPTVLSGLDPDSLALREEPFGPLALVTAFDTVDQAIAEANRLSFGLAAYAHTADLRLAERLAREIEAGTLAINHWQASWPETPFGGLKDSGLAGEGGAEGVLAFCQTRFVSVQG